MGQAGGKMQVAINGNQYNNLTVRLYDVKGRMLQSVNVPQGANQITFVNTLSAGLHFVELQAGQTKLVRKKVYTLK